jgi:CRP-like cAMP-binding protein
MVWLRILAAVALSFEAIYLFVESDKPLWVSLIWSAIFIIINIAQLVLIYRERAKTRLDQAEQLLKQRLFPALSDMDFFYLLQAAERKEVAPGTALTTQGERLNHLHVITQGRADVVVNGQIVATLGEGSLVGEVSFFRDDVATASVLARDNLQSLSLGRAQLRALMRERAAIGVAVHESIGKDMGEKLTAFAKSTF